MKKILVLLGIFVFTQINFSTSCYFYTYEKNNDKVTYIEKTPDKTEKEIKEADYGTFVMLDRSGLAKDKNHLYYRGDIVNGIDGKTVEVVLKQSENPNMKKKVINGIEINMPTSTAAHCFTPYIVEIKDKNGQYLVEKIKKWVNGVDPKTYEVIDSNYSKDKNTVYYNGKKIDEADPKTFKVQGYLKAEDKNNYYEYGEVVK